MGTANTAAVVAFPKGWVRTFPDAFEPGPADYLAQLSGAWERERAGEGRLFQWPNGRWAERLAGVGFADVDAGYLGYVAGGDGPVSRAVAGWLSTPAGAAHWGRRERAVREAQLAANAAEREGDVGAGGAFVEGARESGFIPSLDETPDDGRLAGRAWGSEGRDWLPARHECHAILARIKARRTDATYESHKAGTFVKGAMIVVAAADGEKRLELPGRWLPEFTATGLEFVDRHAWDAVLWAASELRELYTRVVENGELCVPADSDLGPVAWVYETVAGVMAHVPAGVRDDRLGSLMADVRKMANAVLDAAERMGEDVPPPLDLGRFCDLVDADARRKSTLVKVSRPTRDVALCETW
jgi:hypothetical protein